MYDWGQQVASLLYNNVWSCLSRDPSFNLCIDYQHNYLEFTLNMFNIFGHTWECRIWYYTINNFPWGQHGKMKDPRPGTRGGLTWPRPVLEVVWPDRGRMLGIRAVGLGQVRPPWVPGLGSFILPCWPNGKLSIVLLYRKNMESIYIVDRVNIQYWPG